MLVGLRWWSQINDDGVEEWIFESMDDDWQSNAVNSKVFWMGMYVAFGLWLAFAFVALFSLNLSGVTICAVCALLTFINLMGYQRCQKDKK